MKSLISTIAIAATVLTQTAFAAETPTVHTDAYTIVSTMAKTDIVTFIKFTESLNGTMINMVQWDSIDKSYKLSKPSYSVVTSKFYNHDNTVCTDIAVSVEQGGTIGTGTGTMCKSADSWIILEE
jgi:predicted transglutaminase-like protease